MAQVVATAAAHRARRVDRVVLRIGPLSGVEPQLLDHAFAIARGGTIAANAVLEVQHAPVTVACTLCGATGEAAPNRLLCPACGTWKVRVTGGDDLLLASLDLADIDATEQENA